MSGFVHLNIHSEYSLLESAIRVKDIPGLAKKHGHTAAALTDRGAMYGAVEFYTACIDAGIKPIIGCEVQLTEGSRFRRGTSSERLYDLVLLCENNKGYKNLMRLVSHSWIDGTGAKPCADRELLETYSDGIIALSGGRGSFISRAIVAGNFAGAEEYAARLANIFGRDNFYLALSDHGVDEERSINSYICEISKKYGIGLVAANSVCYAKREDAGIRDILISIKNGAAVSDGQTDNFEGDGHYYKSTEEMEALFGHTDGGSPIENTVKIAERCNVTLDFDTVYMPKFPFTNGIPPEKYLFDLTETGLAERLSRGQIKYDDKFSEEDYRRRIKYEFDVVAGTGYCEYYLVVHDFIMFAKNSGIPVGPGRGSGAGSLIAFLVGITDIDPLRYGLLFERFLNPERKSRPDFDVDFCYDRRDEVIAYVKEKYGDEHVAQIITFGTLAARAAVRDVGRALGMSYSDVDKVASLIPKDTGITLGNLLNDKNSALYKAYTSSDDAKKIIDIAREIEGMPRHSSTHAAGVVITDKSLSDIVPLAVNGDTVVTQYDMNTIAKLGLVKFDFLGLRYLTIISDTVRLIKEREPEFDIGMIPTDDEKTFNLIGDGETLGVFQLESSGMRRMLRKFKPSSISDIIAAIALFRPGPMESIPAYIERKNGGGEMKYKDPRIAKILEETYGCIVYQEQVMQIFCAVAGYSLAEADVVRGAMAKKKADVLLSERERFISGAVEGGMSEADAASLFDDMESFSSYAFNKSHAAAYAVISYETAYLKCRYTKEFMASLLDSVFHSGGKTSDYILECEKRGIKVLPPDINESRAGYTAIRDEPFIRYGLGALKGLGIQQIDCLVAERERGGRYRSFYDFASRVSSAQIGKKQAEVLIKSGAFDSLGVARRRLMASFEEIMDGLHERQQRSVSGQMDMFSKRDNPDDEKKDAEDGDYEYPDLPEYSRKQLLSLEKESSGMYFSGHILDDFSSEIEKIPHADIGDILRRGADGESFGEGADGAQPDTKKETCIIGIIVRRTERKTKNGAPIMFLDVEDKTGVISVIVPSFALGKCSDALSSDDPLVTSGIIGRDRFREEASFICHSASLLKKGADKTSDEAGAKHMGEPSIAASTAAAREATKLYIRLDRIGSPIYKRVRGLIEIFSGTLPVFIYDEESKSYTRFESCGANGKSARLIAELKELLGEENVVLK
ncbi:MAG: DNA polymerase III subunit alpha [Clostridia bacterium]|nr:DNA polymerase III subunit alpha [Clostridia bacterium]